jgi:hypothetical protein
MRSLPMKILLGAGRYCEDVNGPVKADPCRALAS